MNAAINIRNIGLIKVGVRRQRWIAMSESLNVLRTERYEARVKVMLVTAMAEADRQREEWNLSNEAQKPLRKATGLNKNEPTSSTVIYPPSNGMNVCVEPVLTWRRQHQVSANSVWIPEHTGVAGQACGEGYSREDGRDCMVPMILTVCMRPIKRPKVDSLHVHRSKEVSGVISGSEVLLKDLQPVRQANIRDETSAMEAEPKGPDFCNASGEGQGYSSRQDRREEA